MADFIVDPATAMQSTYTKIDMPFKFSDKSEARTSYRRRLLVEDGDDTPLAVIPREDSVFGKVDREFDGEIDAEILGVPSGARVLEIHSQLQKVSDDLNDMVEDLLEEREKDFFLAYRTHMFTVQRELTSLKNLSDSNETKGRRVQKVRSLEAELQWFTAEALRLDDLCKKHQKRLERFRGNVQELEDDRAFLEEEITASRTEFKALKNAVGQAQTAVERREDRARSGGIPGDTESRAERDSRGREQHSIGPEQSTDTLQEGELRERYDQVVEDLSRSIRTEKAAINRLRDDAGDKMRESSIAQPGPVEGLADIFTRCVDEEAYHWNDSGAANTQPRHRRFCTCVHSRVALHACVRWTSPIADVAHILSDHPGKPFKARPPAGTISLRRAWGIRPTEDGERGVKRQRESREAAGSEPIRRDLVNEYEEEHRGTSSSSASRADAVEDNSNAPPSNVDVTGAASSSTAAARASLVPTLTRGGSLRNQEKILSEIAALRESVDKVLEGEAAKRFKGGFVSAVKSISPNFRVCWLSNQVICTICESNKHRIHTSDLPAQLDRVGRFDIGTTGAAPVAARRRTIIDSLKDHEATVTHRRCSELAQRSVDDQNRRTEMNIARVAYITVVEGDSFARFERSVANLALAGSPV
ncbi:hypothetical protein FOZ61_007021, partial [Perkinsus olseni]